MKDSGPNLHCEVLIDIGQILQSEVLTESG